MKRLDLSLKEFKKESEIMKIVILRSIEKSLKSKVILTSYPTRTKFLKIN